MKSESTPRKWWRPELALSLLGLGVVGWYSLQVSGQTSPGDLSAVHAAVKELRGSEGCAACHGEQMAAKTMDVACLVCHEKIAEQTKIGQGIHSKAPANTECGACHLEHKGREFAQVQDASFERLGIGNPKFYNHADVDYNLEGAHAKVACERCHPNAHKLVLAKGEFRFLGLSQTCTACHEDVHEGTMGDSCARCHGQAGAWDKVAAFVHTDEFLLEGGHAGLTCVQCHTPGTKNAVDLALDRAPTSVRTCLECHESPHKPTLVSAAEEDCARCHSTQHDGFVQVPSVELRPLHSATGFALEGAHTNLDCSACHPKEGSFPERFTARQACVDCHADPHGDGFDHGTLAQVVDGRASCVRCHDPKASAWSPTLFFDHGVATGYALVGAHGKLECAACHTSTSERKVADVRFPGRGAACARCHDDPHLALFAEEAVSGPLSSVLATPATDCARCHDQEAFQKVEPFDHAATGYPLTGLHSQVECAACHKYDPEPKVRLARARPTGVAGALDCSPCHADPHGSRFDAVGLPAEVGGRVGCERCHSTESFHEVDSEHFDHGLWTSFDLLGAHQQIRCSDCHGSSAQGELLVASFADKVKVQVQDCAQCHESPHGRVFLAKSSLVLPNGKEDCVQCHDNVSFRTTPNFDHAATGFALLGKHAGAQCIDCHRLPTTASLGRRLHPAPGTECAVCHADPHLGQFGKATDCADCHQGFETFLIPAFDHDTTGFPLDKTHAPLACTACHKTSQTSAGEEAVRYRPLGKRCVDCHSQGQKGKGGDQ